MDSKNRVMSFHHDLPIEIITQVFVHFVRAQQPYVSTYEAQFSKADCSAPLILSAICPAWRDITMGTPQLWTALNIQILYSSNKISMQLKLLDIWLDCSKKLPLHVSLLSSRRDEYDPTFNSGDLIPIFSRLKMHSERLETLRCFMPRTAYPFLFQELSNIPSVRKIHLGPRWNTEMGYRKLDLSKIPTLQELHLSSLDLSELKVAWNNLTVFETASVEIDELLEVLRRAPCLKRLSIDINVGEYFTSVSSLPMIPAISNESLEDLELRSTESEILLCVVESITLPSLQRFSYRDSNSSGTANDDPFCGWGLNHLRDLFARSRCQLKRLEITGIYESEEHKQLVEILEGLPYLEHLALGRYPCSKLSGWHVGWLSDDFFTEHADFATLSRLLPRLRILQITGMQGFSWDTLLEFLNLAHLHIAQTGLDRISIQILLVHIGQPGYEDEFISLPVVSEFAQRKWEQSIDLLIFRDFHMDLIKASLIHHGLESLLAK